MKRLAALLRGIADSLDPRPAQEVVVNVHTNGLVDPREMTKQIHTELIKLKRRRGGGSLGGSLGLS